MRRPRIGLSGSAGTGKSTLGLALARALEVPYLPEGMRSRLESGLDLHSLTHRQLQELTELLHEAGHVDFRDARGPLGLTQRQAGGKFTSREASALIDRLLGNEPSEPPAVAGRAAAETPERAEQADQLDRTRSDMLRGMPADLLATELERRGWTVSPP